jgi:hypothetical protein
MKIGYAKKHYPTSHRSPVLFVGFGNDFQAESVYDDSNVRIINIYTDETMLVLFTFDLIGFFRQNLLDLIETIKSSDIFKVMNPFNPKKYNEAINSIGKTIGPKVIEAI